MLKVKEHRPKQDKTQNEWEFQTFVFHKIFDVQVISKISYFLISTGDKCCLSVRFIVCWIRFPQEQLV